MLPTKERSESLKQTTEKRAQGKQIKRNAAEVLTDDEVNILYIYTTFLKIRQSTGTQRK